MGRWRVYEMCFDSGMSNYFEGAHWDYPNKKEASKRYRGIESAAKALIRSDMCDYPVRAKLVSIDEDGCED